MLCIVPFIPQLSPCCSLSDLYKIASHARHSKAWHSCIQLLNWSRNGGWAWRRSRANLKPTYLPNHVRHLLTSMKVFLSIPCSLAGSTKFAAFQSYGLCQFDSNCTVGLISPVETTRISDLGVTLYAHRPLVKVKKKSSWDGVTESAPVLDVPRTRAFSVIIRILLLFIFRRCHSSGCWNTVFW